MDSLNLQNIKLAKANAKLKYRRLQKITALFRLMEMCTFLFIISRFITQLPVAFKLSGEYFRGLSVTAVNPRFVFILGNAIVVILFLKSGQLSAKEGNLSGNFRIDLYEEYVKSCEKNRSVYKEAVETNKKPRKHSADVYRRNCNRKESKTAMEMHRSHSVNFENPQPEGEGKDDPELWRSMTVKYRKSADLEEKPAAGVGACLEDEMSSEEFRRTVEAFIARQQRFLREEE